MNLFGAMAGGVAEVYLVDSPVTSSFTAAGRRLMHCWPSLGEEGEDFGLGIADCGLTRG